MSRRRVRNPRDSLRRTRALTAPRSHSQLLRHDNIVRLYTWIKTPNKYYLVMECCGRGDLLQHLHSAGEIGEPAAREICTQLFRGVAFCHSLGIMHRDLKLENVLLAEPVPPSAYLVKISDFGLSDLRPFDLSGTYCGSPLYAAPELMDGAARAAAPEGYDASRSDMWSCGIIAYALLTSSLPFDADDMGKLIQLIIKAVPARPLPRHCGVHAADLVGRLIQRDPTRRLSAVECLEHPWIAAADEKEPAAPKPELRAMKSMPGELPSSKAVASHGGGEDLGALAEEGGDACDSSPRHRRGVSATSAFYKGLVERRREDMAAERVAAATTEKAASVETQQLAKGAHNGATEAVNVSEPSSGSRPGGRQLTAEEREAIRAMKQEVENEKEMEKQYADHLETM